MTLFQKVTQTKRKNGFQNKDGKISTLNENFRNNEKFRWSD